MKEKDENIKRQRPDTYQNKYYRFFDMGDRVIAIDRNAPQDAIEYAFEKYYMHIISRFNLRK